MLLMIPNDPHQNIQIYFWQKSHFFLIRSIFLILPNYRIAQMVIAPVIYAEFIKVDKLKDTNRGEKGYGSTGKT